MMNYKQIKRSAVVIGAFSAALYTLIAGKGFFNRPRFREQHEELSRYVDNNYPECSYSPITIHGSGWSSAIRRHGRVVTFVYFSKSPDGTYVFTESKEKLM